MADNKVMNEAKKGQEVGRTDTRSLQRSHALRPRIRLFPLPESSRTSA